jgi:LuxR family maltose regulon positive regulatory protein
LLSQWASQFIQAFSGSHHYILDYLTDEVLASQPEPIQIFLLRTSILDRLTAPLCDALIPEHPYPIPTPHSPLPNTQSLLEHLDAANLFIVPLDSERRWYRYHRLFADLLRARLGQSLGAPGITSLHSRAAGWYESQGMLADAVKHALEAGEFEHAARLVE